jgi:UDP-GlcNAc:undecaprenyl-phosphate/decaprenyl-phosphate GlcNAc-1-phosphate transferase
MFDYSIKIFLLQIFISYIIISISFKLKLLDYPSERKIHKHPIPYTGGLILSFTFLFIVFLTDYENSNINLILSYSILASLTGFIDDKYHVNPGTKLILQSLPIFLLIQENIFLKDLGYYELYNFGYINLGSFDKIFTFFCCLFLINACNYTDGIDGLLPSIVIIILISFFFLLLNIYEIRLDYIIIISFTFIIFLFFNLNNSKFKIFLGNSGSNLCGLILSFISITVYLDYNLHPVLIIWPLAYIVYEFLAINIIRFSKKKKVFEPGQDHIHHILKNKFNGSQLKSLLVILLINLVLILFGYILFIYLEKLIVLIVYIVIFLFYLFFRFKICEN